MAKTIEVHILTEGLPGETKLTVGAFATYALAQQMERALKTAEPRLETAIESLNLITHLPEGV